MAAEAVENYKIQASSRGSKREDDKYLWFQNRDQDRMINYQQSFSDDMFFGFLDCDQEFPESYGSSDNGRSQNEEEFYEDEDKDNNGSFGGEEKKFWENQQQLLLVIILNN